MSVSECELDATYSGFLSERSLEPDCNPFSLCVGSLGIPALFVCVLIIQSPVDLYPILYTFIMKYVHCFTS